MRWPACLVNTANSSNYKPGRQPDLFKEIMSCQNPAKIVTELKIPPPCVTKKDNHIPEKHEGLKQMAYVLGVLGNRYQKRGDNIAAILYYLQARVIDPDMEYLSQIAEILEEEGCYCLAYDMYTEAIQRFRDWAPYCSEMSALTSHTLFNFADMLENDHSEIIEKGPVSETRDPSGRWCHLLALELYVRGGELHDPLCLARALVRLDSVKNNQVNGTQDSVRLYKLYTEMIRMEHCRCGRLDGDNDVCKCEIFDRDYSPDICSIAGDREVFEDFLKDNSNLRIALSTERLYERLTNEKSPYATQLEAPLKILKAQPAYVCYKNKMKLFTQLNHVTECSICYETKVNIDLHCAHTFCGDCYARFYNTECPMCRSPCWGSHS